MRFRIRVDEIAEDTQVKLSRLVGENAHVLVKHVLPSGNPHFHLYLESVMYMSCPALRYQLDKIVGCKGADRSVKACDEGRQDEYIQYLFNRKHDNEWTLLSSTIDVTAHQAKAQEVADTFAKQHPKGVSKKKNDVTTWDLAEEVRQRALADDVKPDTEYQIYEQYINHAVDVCRKHRKTYTDFSIQRIVQTAITADKRNRGKFIQAVLDRIFRS